MERERKLTTRRVSKFVELDGVYGHHPTHEEISRKAYELYVRRGCQHGYDQRDWFEAKKMYGISH